MAPYAKIRTSLFAESNTPTQAKLTPNAAAWIGKTT